MTPLIQQHPIPAPITVECISDIPAPDITVVTDEADNCAIPPTVTFVIDSSDGNLCPRIVYRSYRVEDACGNYITVQQTINVSDITPPVLTCPADVTVDCTDPFTPDDVGWVVATDNCDPDPSITYSDNYVAQNCPLTYIVQRTWLVTDTCGNTSTCVQNISINDSNPPTISCPADISIQCLDDLEQAFNSYAEFIAAGGSVIEDNLCSGVDTSTFAIREVVSAGNCPKIYERWYSIADSCGNVDSCVHITTVDDQIAPTLTGVPGNVTIPCDSCIQDFKNGSFEEPQLGSGVSPGGGGNGVTWGYYKEWQVPGWNTLASQNNIEIQLDGAINGSPSHSGQQHAELNGSQVADFYQEFCVIPTSTLVVSWFHAKRGTGSGGANPDNNPDVMEVLIGPDYGSLTHIEYDTAFVKHTWYAHSIIYNVPAGINHLVIVFRAVSQAGQNLTYGNLIDDVSVSTNFGGVAPTAFDNCTNNPAIGSYIDTVQNNCANQFQLRRVWTATDECGNVSSRTQLITVGDFEPPVFDGAPPDMTVSCDDLPTPPTVTAFDSCQGPLTPMFTETIGNGCTYQIIWNWTVDDDCGNMGDTSTVITVIDTTAPVFTTVPPDITAFCDNIPAADPSDASATDNCQNVTITTYDSLTYGCPFRVYRHYVADDGCGNTTMYVQEIFVNDNQDPTVTCPADISVECIGDVPPPYTNLTEFLNSGGTASDECKLDLGYLGLLESLTGICPRTLTRTYEVRDSCGNTSTCTQNIILEDITDPTLNCPSDITISCIEDLPAPYATYIDFENAGGTSSDNCGIDPATFTHIGDVSNNIICPEQITRTYQIQDSCGNTATCDQVIIINDAIDPGITCPPDVILYCPADTSSSLNGIPVVNENCNAGYTVTHTDNIDYDPCGAAYTISRIWRVIDQCGNFNTCTQTLEIRDTTSPEIISVPPDITLYCPNEDTTVSNTGIITASDACNSSYMISYNDIIDQSPCGYSYTISRVWQAEDICGNIASHTQIIEVQDTSRPVITSIPADITLYCPSEDTSVANTGQMTAVDGCSSAFNITHSDVVDLSPCGYAYTINRTWIAEDECNNSISHIQTIEVQDTTRPQITNAPADITLYCPGEDTSASNTGQLTVVDDCSSGYTVIYNDVVDLSPCGYAYTIARTWIAEDECNNSISHIQTIEVQDTTRPQITNAPADITLYCPSEDTSVANTGQMTAVDGCSSAFNITHSDVVDLSPCGYAYTITRTWIAEDECNNSISHIQTIEVQDTTRPQITNAPADITLYCPSEDTSVANTGQMTAVDGCSSAFNITHSDVVDLSPCGYAYTITRTWIAEDECNNSISHIQTIEVQDTTRPQITNAPADITLYCPSEDTSVANTGQMTAVDGCSSAFNITHSDVVDLSPCGYAYTINRTWIAEDECNNSISHIQTIEVQDTTRPQITNAPADITLYCPSEDTSVANTGQMTAVDGCSSAFNITHSDVVDLSPCGYAYTINRTWIAEDECNNSISHIQTIEVQDTTRPQITNAPADITLYCPGEDTSASNTGQLTVVDGCSSGYTVIYNDVVDLSPCGYAYTITRTWIAEDECNNSISHVQIIEVQDTTSPTLVCPDDVILNCPADTTTSTTGIALTTDGCGTSTLTYSDIVTDNCGNTMLIERTWLATDDCGNTATCIQIITVQDTTAPIIVCPPMWFSIVPPIQLLPPMVQPLPPINVTAMQISPILIQ